MEIMTTGGWKCHTRAAPSCDIFNLGSSYFHVPLTTVRHVLTVISRTELAMCAMASLSHWTSISLYSTMRVRQRVSYVYQTWNWVIWVIFHVRVTGSSFWRGVRPEFFRFSKKCPKCKTYIWNAEMTKVIVRCLLLDWNHWMSVHAMNFYFYLWLLKIWSSL